MANGGTALQWACKSYSQDNYARMEPRQAAWQPDCRVLGSLFSDDNHQATVVRGGITVLIIRLASSQQEVDMASYLSCLLRLALGYDSFKRGDVVITAQRIYSGAKRVQGLLSFDFRIIG